jgi:hypothetical protein
MPDIEKIQFDSFSEKFFKQVQFAEILPISMESVKLPSPEDDLGAFLASDDGKELKEFFTKAMDGLIQWSGDNLQGKEKDDTVKYDTVSVPNFS